ncbi:hypothetical protein [Rhizobium sp. NXC24]|uniref:hypothetical protein n=1 Tax=Rhizobium sp. NXC24 TaxID=2048897 RepID=UPI000CDF38D5|nr:hypothetical protein [Rhizobium sp. NXC24]AVA24185.1 hypothetical protein NXC24_PB00252 [Rhizobium sp. NXC24]
MGNSDELLSEPEHERKQGAGVDVVGLSQGLPMTYQSEAGMISFGVEGAITSIAGCRYHPGAGGSVFSAPDANFEAIRLNSDK